MAATYLGAGRLVSALALMLIGTVAVAEQSAQAEQPLRVEQLQRCGNLLTLDIQEFCLSVSGLENNDFQIKLNGTALQPKEITRDNDRCV